MRGLVFAGIGIFLLGTGCSTPSPSRSSASALPEVTAFLTQHPEYGNVVSVQQEPDWAQGRRQRVSLTTKRKFLFYTRGGSVVTVYEDGASGRALLWGEGQ